MNPPNLQCVRCKTPYPSGRPMGGMCLNCGGREFQRNKPTAPLDRPPTGFFDPAKNPPSSGFNKRPPRSGPPKRGETDRQKAPLQEARPRSPTGPGGNQGHVYQPAPLGARKPVEVYEPRAVSQLAESNSGRQQAPPVSDRLGPPVSDRLAQSPDVESYQSDFQAQGYSPAAEAYPKVEEQRQNGPATVRSQKPSIFQTATQDADAFREFLESQEDEADDTSPALRQVTASPLVWSPGSSSQSELIANRYLIRNPREDLLGTGAKGVVYKAYDTVLGGRKVAVKLFFDAFGDLNDPEIIEEEKNRTQREIEIQGELTHPGIVIIHDRFDSEHGSGVVLEFVDGETLEERIDRFKVIPVGDAVRFMIELCKAVEVMHRHAFIHRDIKPGNVLVTRDLNIKLIDFGLSKKKSEKDSNKKGDVTRRLKLSDDSVYKTQEGDIVGTPAYMAPEQAAGNLSEVDEISDVYGLGAILYHCLTGQPPVNKETIEEVLDLVVQGVVPLPRTINPWLDPALEAIVMKALARDRGERFQEIIALREQLISYQDGNPLDPSVYEEPVSKRFTRWLVGHKTMAVVVITVALSVGTLFGGLKIYQSEQQRLESQELLLDARLKASKWELDVAWNACDSILRMSKGNPEALLLLRDINRHRPAKNAYLKSKEQLKKARKAFDNEDSRAAEADYYLALRSLQELERELKLLSLDKATYSGIKFLPLIKAKVLERWIEEAKGLIPFRIEPPQSKEVLIGAKLCLRTFDKHLETKAERLLDFKTGRGQFSLQLPILNQKLPLGNYLAEMKFGKRRHFFPVMIRRRTVVEIGAIPEPPLGMVYVFGRSRFRPGHENHDTLEIVEVKSFYIQVHEVSIRNYLKFLRDLERKNKKEAAKHKPYHWFGFNPSVPNSEWDRPIGNISIESAKAYAEWLTSRTGLTHRLPTEAEWQLAASGGFDDRDYPYGRRYHLKWSKTTGDHPDKVGVRVHDVSPFGVFDMGGNVSEWVRRPEDFQKRFLAKGGSYKGPAPLWQRRVLKVRSSKDVGFRCVIDAPEIPAFKLKKEN